MKSCLYDEAIRKPQRRVFGELPGWRAHGKLGRAACPKRAWIPKSEVRGGGREDPMPEGRQPREVTPCPRSGAAAQSARLQRHRTGREELPKSEARGGGQEDQPHVQGAVAVRAQEGLEELSHAEGQEGRR